ncbi:MAG: hypothetical protein ABI600_12270 [Luteolibacter sp.]
MNFENDIKAQMDAMILCSDDTLRWRAILMFAVLRVSKPGKILDAIQCISPTAFSKKSKIAAITDIRRMLAKIRTKMGLPTDLPVSQTQKENPKKMRPGKPTDAQLEEYRIACCLPWIEQNGGYPRPEQIADILWDLKPYPLALESTTPSNKNPPTLSDAPIRGPIPEIETTPARAGSDTSQLANGAETSIPKAESRVLGKKATTARTAKNILDEMWLVPMEDREAWGKEVIRLKCERHFIINGKEPDAIEIEKLMESLDNTWTNALSRIQENHR